MASKSHCKDLPLLARTPAYTIRFWPTSETVKRVRTFAHAVQSDWLPEDMTRSSRTTFLFVAFKLALRSTSRSTVIATVKYAKRYYTSSLAPLFPPFSPYPIPSGERVVLRCMALDTSLSVCVVID